MRPRSGPCRRWVVAVAVALTVALLGPAAVPVGAEPPSPHTPPVDAPVVDPFRAPSGPYAAGNRGLEYATAPGTEVRATAPGEVTFAGPVGGALHVVVLHGDGLRTSYSFLAGVGVRRGDVVERGAVLGTTGPALHLGARAGDRYVDPALLFGHGAPEVHLIPVEERSAGSVAAERRGLLRALADAGLTGVDALRWLGRTGVDAAEEAGRLAADAARASAELGRAALPVLEVAAELPGRFGRAAGRVVESASAVGHAMGVLVAARRSLVELVADQQGCTPADRPVPPSPPGRRIVVMVGGLGSAGGDADVLDVPTDALGYDPGDRVQFSYAGGRVPGVGALAGVPVAGYGPGDTTVDLSVAGGRLRRLLEDITAAHPGTPIDVIAHSQGGLVAREAMTAPRSTAPDGTTATPGGARANSDTREVEASGAVGAASRAADPGVAGRSGADGTGAVGHVVTLGTPHLGTPAATIAREVGLDRDAPVSAGIGWLSGGAVDPAGVSVGQMAEGSDYLSALASRPLPAGTAFTSIAARGDVVVPATSSTLAGAVNAVVPLGDTSAHGRLTSAPTAVREVGLALRGAGPTCVGTPALVLAVGAAAAVVAVEQALGEAVGPVLGAADDVTATVAQARGAA